MTPHVCGLGIAQCTPIPYVKGPDGPKLANISVDWHRASNGLSKPTNINTIQVIEDGKEVGEARQHCVETVLKLPTRPEFIFFLDYDVLPQHDALTKLLMRARHFPDYDVFAGVYCLKSSVPEPLIYKGWGHGPFWDWTIGDLLTEGITGVHMGCTLIRVSLFDRLDLKIKPAFCTENESFINDEGVHVSNRGTEDLFFCQRITDEIGAKILVDTSVLCGHQDLSTGKIYGLPTDSRPVKGAKWVMPPKGYDKQKKALDLGAGSTRREWPGHTTYTTDIRPGAGVDYVQDSRHLNLPDNHFDLVASSHHLEHIGRWDQEEVWKNIFRVCKPGGKIEHIVPSAEWAAHRVVEDKGLVDEHVANVLYGAQEAHGYERIFNTHFFPYTKVVGQALAEAAGFVNVTCEDWRDNEGHGYNLIIRGERPCLRKPSASPKTSRSKKESSSSPATPRSTRKSSRSRILPPARPTPTATSATTSDSGTRQHDRRTRTARLRKA